MRYFAMRCEDIRKGVREEFDYRDAPASKIPANCSPHLRVLMSPFLSNHFAGVIFQF